MIKYLILFSLIAASLQIPHCKETSKICKSCVNGYTLVKDNYDYSDCIEDKKLKAIQDELPNCIDANDEYTECISCERGYVWSSLQKKCIQKTHCEELDEDDKCEECGYYTIDLDSGNCIEKSFCYLASGNKCKECFPYYYLKDNGECERISIPHCIYLDESNKCSECDDYYYAKDGICENNPEHCESYNNLEGKCNNCENGYYLSDDKECKEVQKVENCEKYQDNYNRCSYCSNSYYLDNNNKCIEVTNLIDKCIYYSSSTQCSGCDDGYKPSEDGKECKKLCDTEEICEECEFSYVSYDYGKTCTLFGSQTNDGKRIISINSALVIILLFVL